MFVCLNCLWKISCKMYAPSSMSYHILLCTGYWKHAHSFGGVTQCLLTGDEKCRVILSDVRVPDVFWQSHSGMLWLGSARVLHVQEQQKPIASSSCSLYGSISCRKAFPFKFRITSDKEHKLFLVWSWSASVPSELWRILSSLSHVWKWKLDWFPDFCLWTVATDTLELFDPVCNKKYLPILLVSLWVFWTPSI